MSGEVKTLQQRIAEFQDKCPPIGFDNSGQVGTRTYGYATLPAILRITRPVLRECGLVVIQRVVGDSVETVVAELEGTPVLTVRVDLTECADMQKLGSAITYARRYGYITALGLCPDEDDDGAATVATQAPAAPAPPRVKTPEGWASDDDVVGQHNDLVARIHALPEDMQAQFRDQPVWPLPKDKFLELAALVFTAEGLAS